MNTIKYYVIFEVSLMGAFTVEVLLLGQRT